MKPTMMFCWVTGAGEIKFEESCWFAISEVPQVKTLSHTGETEERGGPLLVGGQINMPGNLHYITAACFGQL